MDHNRLLKSGQSPDLVRALIKRHLTTTLV